MSKNGMKSKKEDIKCERISNHITSMYDDGKIRVHLYRFVAKLALRLILSFICTKT